MAVANTLVTVTANINIEVLVDLKLQSRDILVSYIYLNKSDIPNWKKS